MASPGSTLLPPFLGAGEDISMTVECVRWLVAALPSQVCSNPIGGTLYPLSSVLGQPLLSSHNDGKVQ
uniref:Uncharacterized protein n=1 Tax=Arundo donax TaxID=35708 RepID=A0A0A8YUC3_ARUDO